MDRFASTNSNVLRIRKATEFKNLDVLFLGNSYAYSAINTYALDSADIQSFNLGIASAGVGFYHLIVEDYFKNADSLPARLMILVSPMTFSSKSDKWEKYRIHRYLLNPMSNWRLGSKYNAWSSIFPLYRESFKKGLHNTLKGTPNSVETNFENWHKGFVANEYIFKISELPDEERKYNNLSEDEFNTGQIDILLELARRIEDKGVEVSFFEIPTNLIKNYFSLDFLIAYEQGVQRISEGYKLLRIPTTLYGPDCYRDIDHMNTRGSIITTEQIVRFIRLDSMAIK